MKYVMYMQLYGDERQLIDFQKEYASDDNTLSARIEIPGFSIEIKIFITTIQPGNILIRRSIIAKQRKEQPSAEGIRFISEVWPIADEKTSNSTWRICIPSLIYDKSGGLQPCQRKTYREDRLPAAMVSLYSPKEQTIYSFSKKNHPLHSTKPVRQKGQSEYLQKTEICSVGYQTDRQANFMFLEEWPYAEHDKSVMLDSKGTPAEAYFPLENGFQVEHEYILHHIKGVTFSQGVYQSFCDLAEKTRKDTCNYTYPEISIVMENRLQSLGRCYRDGGENGIGFFFHFDPCKGYGEEPSGFGASFCEIPHNTYTHILEYGFTGRQMNAAYIMASMKGGEWIERGEKTADFFVRNCVQDSGWVFTLFDTEKKQPFFALGQDDAPKIHYVGRANEKGNYLRTMTEAMYDLLELERYYESLGRDKNAWKDAVFKYADFLVKVQNEDGSYARAYTQDGKKLQITNSLGKDESSTAFVIPFLVRMCRFSREHNMKGNGWEAAVKKAGKYVKENYIDQDYYEGGTLDNPNVVDKESVQYAMAAMYDLYLLTKEEDYLKAAQRAAHLFVTWNYIWKAPLQDGTVLAEYAFNTCGFGAINSIWGGGVVDIYSLFHVKELSEIGKQTNDSFLCAMAKEIVESTGQYVSVPEKMLGFADSGMQPEGFGICPQGADEGMILKGDIWGSLGWIYSAGIYGIRRYLKE